MPKRRNVILGLGALAFGSGATTMSGAFDTDFASPDADLRVIADAALRVRSARDNSNSPIVQTETTDSELGVGGSSDRDISDTGSLTSDWSTFYSNTVEPLISQPGTPSVAALEINEQNNDQLGIRSAFSNRLDGEVDPLLEVTNNSGSNYNIRISYATNNDSNLDQIDSTGENGYGSDVNKVEDTSGEYTNSGSDQVSRQEVQGIYQFRLTDEDPHSRNAVGSSANNLLISPDPTDDGSSVPADEGANSYELADGTTAYIKLDFNTDAADIDGDSTDENLTGIINSAAGSGSTAFGGNDDLDLLDKIYVTADEVTS